MLLITILALVVAITVHEFAHGLAADRLGDPTPRIQGRLSLNPLAHLDWIGSFLVPAFLILSGSPLLFGWAKPVQFDPYNLERPRRDAALISFAGPLANLLLAIFFGLLFQTATYLHLWEGIGALVARKIVEINVVLAVFNLVPIHPLDGGKILVGLLPPRDALVWDRFLNQYGFILLLFLILPFFGGASLLWTILGPTIDFLLKVILQGPRFV